MSIELENNPDKKVLKICHNLQCGYKSYQSISRCPKCRRPMWTTNEFRLLMSLLIPLGGFVVAVGLGLIIALERNSGAWTSGKAAFYFIYGIAGVLTAMGLSVISFGLWCVIFGKASKGLFKIMTFGFMALLLIVGFGKLILTILSD